MNRNYWEIGSYGHGRRFESIELLVSIDNLKFCSIDREEGCAYIPTSATVVAVVSSDSYAEITRTTGEDQTTLVRWDKGTSTLELKKLYELRDRYLDEGWAPVTPATIKMAKGE